MIVHLRQVNPPVGTSHTTSDGDSLGEALVPVPATGWRPPPPSKWTRQVIRLNGMEIDAAGATQTKHDWLVDQLRKLIRQLPPGSAFPPERSLATEFDVARMTIRQALSVLERNGEIERRQGAGTFTSLRKLDHKLRITSFTDDIKQLGMNPSTINLGGGKFCRIRRSGTWEDCVWPMICP